jgi:hypothetical protein
MALGEEGESYEAGKTKLEPIEARDVTVRVRVRVRVGLG